MKAIIKRELKNYAKNPIYWIGLVLVLAAVYQMLAPYLKIDYFKSDQEIRDMSVTTITDADIMEGYIPSSPEQQLELGSEIIRQAMIEDMGLSEEEADDITSKVKGMDIQEAARYLEQYGYYGAEYVFEDLKYHQGSMEEVNQYIEEKMQQHSYSYYFVRKLTDFGGLFLAFFTTVLFAFLFLQDTRKSTYELLHTKPVRAWQYVLGKISGGFLAVLFPLGVLNLLFFILCNIQGKKAGFTVCAADFAAASCIYILPNMLMIICVYAIAALLFKNPLPAVPLLFLYIVYSNMGSRGPDGSYGYYGRPLAIMVRFPGRFFDSAPPPMILMNQVFLIIASAVLIVLAVYIWKRRRVY